MTASENDTSQVRESIEGVTSWMRSDRDDCICCPGQHVFGYNLDLDLWTDRDYHNTERDWFWQAIRRMPEGARVRVTVETVDA